MSIVFKFFWLENHFCFSYQFHFLMWDILFSDFDLNCSKDFESPIALKSQRVALYLDISFLLFNTLCGISAFINGWSSLLLKITDLSNPE